MAAAQDDARENRLVDIFNLERPANRVRHGIDALLTLDGDEYEFELKSITTTKGGLTTVRDFGPDHITKWRTKHWIVALYSGDQLTACKYASPDDVSPWVEGRWNYVKADFSAAELVPGYVTMDAMEAVLGKKSVYTAQDAKNVQKQQYSAAKYKSLMDVTGGYSPETMLNIYRDRVKYLLLRGSTLNNPKIPQNLVEKWATIKSDHASELRSFVRAWKAAKDA